MFKFLKEMFDAVKEGANEGLAEANQEIAAEAAVKNEKKAQAVAALARRLATTPQAERMAAALAAPYRETFLLELESAATDQRPAVYLFCAGLADNEVTSWKDLLARDFDVSSSADAEMVIAGLMADISPATSNSAVAVALCRAAHVATGAAGIGYVPIGQALDWCLPLVDLAASRFSAWEAYGQAFLAGEANAPGSNMLGRKFLARAVKRLNENAASPWRSIPWPAVASPGTNA